MIDVTWRAVAKAVVDGRLGQMAKVSFSTPSPRKKNVHGTASVMILGGGPCVSISISIEVSGIIYAMSRMKASLIRDLCFYSD